MTHIDEEQQRGSAEQLRLREQLRIEKALRIKYQGLVFAACRLVDEADGVSVLAGRGVTIGGLEDGLRRTGMCIVNLRRQLKEAEARAEFEDKSAQAWCEMCHEAQKRVAESQQNWMLQRQQLNNERRLCWEAERGLEAAEARLSKWEKWQMPECLLAEAKRQLESERGCLTVVTAGTLEFIKAQARRDALEEAAALVDRWAMSYPTSVFPQPPPGQHAEMVDGCSAAALRSVLPQLAAAIRALAGDPRPEEVQGIAGMWCIDETDDGRVLLTAPDGTVALHVDKGRAEVLGRMLLDTAGDEGGK